MNIKTLENETSVLKASKECAEKEIEEYKAAVSTLEAKLNSSDSAVSAANEKIKTQLILISNREKGIYI